MSVRSILRRSFEPLAGLEPGRQEREGLARLKAAVLEMTILKAADRMGEEVDEELKRARKHIASLRERLPRGDAPAFLGLIMVYILTALGGAVVYNMLGEVLRLQWQGEAQDWTSHWYLREFRPASTWMWQWARSLFGAPRVFGISSALALSALWSFQHRLQRRYAHLLLGFLTLGLIFLFFAFTISGFGLLLRPMIH